VGITDKLWVKLSCPQCGKAETASSNDKGSTWGGPSWTGLTEFQSFSAHVTGGGKTEPEVSDATCNTCGAKAKVESTYGFGRPPGY